MIRVAVETSTGLGSVAVGRHGDVLAEVELGEQTRHAARALPALQEALAAAGVDRGEIDAVVVGAGPGSFTGVRVAGATAKGLATALRVPLLAYSSLLAAARAADAADPGGSGPVCVLFDARRGEVYAGCWAVREDRLVEVLAPTVGEVAGVVERLAAAGAAVRFAGEGALRYADELADATAAAGLAAGPALDARPGAAALLWLADHHPDAGAVTDVGAWEPRYVRGSSAERGVPG